MADNGPDFGKSKFFKDLVEQLGLDIKDVPLHVANRRVVPPPGPTVAQVNKLFALNREVNKRIDALLLSERMRPQWESRVRKIEELKDRVKMLERMHNAQAHDALDDVDRMGTQIESLTKSLANIYGISQRRKLKVASVAASIKFHIENGTDAIAKSLCDYLINMTYTKED